MTEAGVPAVPKLFQRPEIWVRNSAGNPFQEDPSNIVGSPVTNKDSVIVVSDPFLVICDVPNHRTVE